LHTISRLSLSAGYKTSRFFGRGRHGLWGPETAAGVTFKG